MLLRVDPEKGDDAEPEYTGFGGPGAADEHELELRRNGGVEQ